jgi:hypothetical protein
MRSMIFEGQIGRQICEVRWVGNFGRLGRSWKLTGREVWKDSECGTVGRNFSRVINVVLHLLVQSVSYP